MENQIKEQLREFIDEIISEHNHDVGNWIQNSPGSMESEKSDNDKLEAKIRRWETKRDALLQLMPGLIIEQSCLRCGKSFMVVRRGRKYCSKHCGTVVAMRMHNLRKKEAKKNVS